MLLKEDYNAFIKKNKPLYVKIYIKGLGLYIYYSLIKVAQSVSSVEAASLGCISIF
ncbi:MAG: hypothetical protein ACFWUE_12550 [Xylanivirga thermophila]|jgi:hypothetical protein